MVNRFRIGEKIRGKGGTAQTTYAPADLEERIRKKAYELYEQRGCQEGHALDDWLAAERSVS